MTAAADTGDKPQPVLRRLPLRVRRPGGMAMRIVMFLVLLATVLKASGLGELIGPQTDVIALSVLVAAVAIFLPLCLSGERYLPAFVVAVGVLAMFALAHVNFVRLSGSALNFNAILAYFPALIFLPLARSRVSIDRSLRYLVWISAAYILFYTLGHGAIETLAQASGAHILKAGDYERGARLLFAPAFAAFLFFFMMEWRRGNLLLRVMMMGLSVAALWLSNYRTFLVIFLLVVVMRAARLLNPMARWLIFGVVVAAYGALLAGLVLPDWEPFAYFVDDASGFARLLAYRHITPFVLDHWLTGVGVAGSNLALQSYLRVPTFYSVYPTDLGPIGPLFVFGVGGLLLYIVLTWVMIVQRLPIRFGSTHPERMALHMTAMVCGIQGVISPSFMIENNSLFLAFMFAGWVQLRRMRPVVGGGPNPLAFKPRVMAPGTGQPAAGEAMGGERAE